MICDMRITLPDLPELTDQQAKDIDEAVIEHRKAAYNSFFRDSPTTLNWAGAKYWGHIHHLKTNRFFIYFVRFDVKMGQMDIQVENTKECTQDQWLDHVLEMKVFKLDDRSYERHIK